MSKHKIEWYKIGKKLIINDKMQKNYSYVLSAPYGKKFAMGFNPELSPRQMLILGIFEGKYLNDCANEFPVEWYEDAKKKDKLRDIANASINLFGIKSRLSLQEWRKRKWIPIIKGDKDVRGWFQWYCRYYIGRRDSIVDDIQIKRWRAFIRHKGQIIKSIVNMKPNKRPKNKTDIMKHRPRQRQALLQWAYNPFVIK